MSLLALGAVGFFAPFLGGFAVAFWGVHWNLPAAEIAGIFQHNRVVMDRMRSIAFALLTPFYFLKAGSLVSLPVPITTSGAGLVAALFLTKMLTKTIGIRPPTRQFGLKPRLGNYTTLLMSTGLTFGTIAALFGLSHGYISTTQYTVLVTVVILSAIVPTMIAQHFFQRTTILEAALAMSRRSPSSVARSCCSANYC
jgi:Kef-type K+ transport system membrane component KefB